MPDREKVIKELEWQINVFTSYCASDDRHLEAMKAALALLKEQTSDTRKNRVFNCAECGYGIDDIFINDEGKYPILPNYCPNCGRMVK